MSQYWAKFKEIDGATFRLDTRIYLSRRDLLSSDDICLGAIVGKNPGSAKETRSSDLQQQIDLDGDMLLPTVRRTVETAYRNAKVNPPRNGYIQVLNLFYLCNENLTKAVSAMTARKNACMLSPLCESERGVFPWVWYVWGGPTSKLDDYKLRFADIATNHHFFLDKHTNQIETRMPRINEFAKHTQGMRIKYVLPHLSMLIANLAAASDGQ